MKFFLKLLLALGLSFSLLGSAMAQEVSQEAKRHMFRGQAAMEEAELTTDASGYRDAISEFKQATRLAPDWADAWFNLGIAQEKAEDYSGAMASFKSYLVLAPNAPDYAEVEGLIFKLEYKRDKAREAKVEKTRAKSGIWTKYFQEKPEWRYAAQITVSGTSFKLVDGFLSGNRSFTTGSGGPGKRRFTGIIQGLSISGTVEIDYTEYSNGSLYSKPFTGKISKNGKVITLEWRDWAMSSAADNKITGTHGWVSAKREYRDDR